MHCPGPVEWDNIIYLPLYQLCQISIDQNAGPSHQSSYRAGAPVILLPGLHDFCCLQLISQLLLRCFLYHFHLKLVHTIQASRLYWQIFSCKCQMRDHRAQNNNSARSVQPVQHLQAVGTTSAPYGCSADIISCMIFLAMFDFKSSGTVPCRVLINRTQYPFLAIFIFKPQGFGLFAPPKAFNCKATLFFINSKNF